MAENFYDKFYKHSEKKSKSKTEKNSETKQKALKSKKENHTNSEKKFSQKPAYTDQHKTKSPVYTDQHKPKPPAYTDQHKSHTSNPFTIENSLFLNEALENDTVSILNNFDEIIQGVRPLNSRQLQQLPDNIKALSHQLTDQRSERRLGYMNDNIQLSSYVRYYTWWNLVRLTRLFSNLPEELFPKKESICLDLGTGPLTLIIALWLARPELRKLKLTWYCLDVSANSMALGEDIYLSVAARSNEEPWKIIRVKGPFGTSIRQKADFITCANMFNELDQAGEMPPEYQTKKYFDQLKTYSSKDAHFLLIEPGVPKASRTLSLLRGRFISDGKEVLAPCSHAGDCPMNGFKAYKGSQNKWCNFAFSTEDAPEKLQKLSEKAKLPKERATLSFLAVSDGGQTPKKEDLLCRVASDSFTLPGHTFGHYACSSLGLLLLRTKGSEMLKSGDLISVKIKRPDSLPKDEKSGALIISL